MKKIITLFVVVIIGVVTANATTKRIYLEAQNGWTTVHIHLYKGNTNLYNGEWPGLQMNRIGGTQWFYLDFDSEETEATCIVNSNGYDKSPEYAIDLSQNNVIYMYNQDGTKLSVQTFDGYVISGDYNKSTKITDLNQNGLTLTGTLDLSGATGDTHFRIHPSFLSDNTYYVLAIAPVSDNDYELSSFINYTWNTSYTSVKTWCEKLHMKYDVTVDLANGSFAFSPYFERTLNLAAEGYATFSSIYDVTPDANLTVKYVSAVDASGNITWTNYTGGIQAGQGVLLEGTAGSTYKFTPSSSASAPSTNFLKPINEKTQLAQTSDGKTNYILTNKKADGTTGTLGFYKVNSAGSWCSAGTAYLSTTAPTPARGYFSLEDEDATAIEGIANENDINLPVYDLQGRRVTSPQKGLYIVNGKKVVIK